MEPREIFSVRHGNFGLELLSRWKNFLEFKEMWESLELIRERSPEFKLGDKLDDMEGSVGMILIVAYNRHHKRSPHLAQNEPVESSKDGGGESVPRTLLAEEERAEG